MSVTSTETSTSTEIPEAPRARVLIVEDERPLILMVRRILTKEGFEVVAEVSVDAGLQRLASEPFDLVLLDYKLPEKHGTEMVKVLGERLKTLPVIMLTGFTDVRLAVEVLKAGVADYVVKDARLEFIRSLPKKIEDVLERFELKRQNLELQQKIADREQSLGAANRAREDMTRQLEERVRRPLAAWVAELDGADAERGRGLVGALQEILRSGVRGPA